MPRFLAVAILALVAACGAPSSGTRLVTPRDGAHGPRVLGVIAHPDDETAFAATFYEITARLDGVCDLAVITNGEGGYKYSTLAERIYGVELTDEAQGRARLPAIRKRELAESASILGVRELTFLDQVDHRYTTDAGEVLGADAHVWDLELVRTRLHAILEHGAYDFVFGLLPSESTHAHHKAATILALEAAAELALERRPVVLAARVVDADDASRAETLPQFAITRLDAGAEPFVFDRLKKFGYEDKLDDRIVVNWVIAAHKSQGTMQLAANRGEREQFWSFALNGDGARARAAKLFADLDRERAR
jgi:LmbE family N-acetylglucosaminyl deacetylase